MEPPLVDGLEVIDFSKSKEEEAKKPFEIRLTNGQKVLVHEETAYENFYTDGRSFEDVENDVTKDSELIEFSFDFQVHKDGLKEMKKIGNTIHSNPMAVYHGHVMWCYAYSITAIKEDGEDLLCTFAMHSLGPSFSRKEEIVKGGVGRNVPAKQVAPTIEKAMLVLKADGVEQKVDIIIDRDGLHADSLLPLSALLGMSESQKTVIFALSIQIPREYFSLKTLIDLEKKEPAMGSAVKSALDVILAGEKPPKYDWVITVGEGTPREFYVHRKVVADAFPPLELAMKLHSSLNQQLLLMVSHENRFILPKNHADDMKVLLTYMYARQRVLPPWDGTARVGRTLAQFLPRDQLNEFFASWERQMINEVIKLDKKSHMETIIVCLKYLVSVFSAPYGAMPVAKRVIVSVMADTWHLAEDRGVDLESSLKEAEDAGAGLAGGLAEKVLSSVGKFRTVVAGIRKRKPM